MKTGLLWFDDSKRNLADKIARGITHYTKKFNAAPTTCYIRDTGELDHVGAVQVRALPTVLRHHLWIGREEKAK